MTDKTNAQQQLRIQQESKCGSLAAGLKAQLRPDEGFVLLLFNYDDGGGRGNMSYASNASSRDEVANMLRELAACIESDARPDGIVERIHAAKALLETWRNRRDRLALRACDTKVADETAFMMGGAVETWDAATTELAEALGVAP